MLRAKYIEWWMGLICMLAILISGGVFRLLLNDEYLAACLMFVFDLLIIAICYIHLNLWKHGDSVTNDIKDMEKRVHLAKMERKSRKHGRKMLAERMSNNIINQWIIRVYFVLVREMDK